MLKTRTLPRGKPMKITLNPLKSNLPLEPQDSEPCLLTLQPWLQPEAETGTTKGPMESPDEMITHELLSMKQEEYAPSFDLGIDQTQTTQDENQIQQLGDQFKTPDLLQ
ncbi:hypothetical protein PIB30_102851 [Stylosanthes scabra]|uniref:Uncharacterized protein n=1 Tax=Stylosanthes scabra TaxID=79078 RepID=A0ABU6WWC3_9FABA|nr:hypothetical protein [Stylosanthes scabra]